MDITLIAADRPDAFLGPDRRQGRNMIFCFFGNFFSREK
jgi:hypothetical protein